MSNSKKHDLLALTAKITAAYVRQNNLEPQGLPELIESVHVTLKGLAAQTEDRPEIKAEPAISIEDSVTDEFIYSLEDGQPYKSLKRHLRSKYNMTPEAYREKWNLPLDYPMVAPAYARRRSQLAKKSGLGKGPR